MLGWRFVCVGLPRSPVLILGVLGYVCTDWGMVVYGWFARLSVNGMRWTVDFYSYNQTTNFMNKKKDNLVFNRRKKENKPFHMEAQAPCPF